MNKPVNRGFNTAAVRIGACVLSVHPLLVTVASCALGFILGLIFTQRSGNYFVTMFDDYSATLPLVIVVIFETFSVAWVYGTDR